MKRILLSLSIFICLSASAQKKDTTVTMTCTLDEYRAFVSIINQNIDSKKAADEITNFMYSKTKTDADKPKEIKK